MLLSDYSSFMEYFQAVYSARPHSARIFSTTIVGVFTSHAPDAPKCMQ